MPDRGDSLKQAIAQGRSTKRARQRELALLEKLLGRFWDSMGDDFRPEDHVTIGNAYAIVARARDAAQ
jgi:hypothetical protein